MNYHSDEWIMAGVQRHYNEVLTKYRPEQVVAVCYTGSANYNADSESSDIDTWALIIEDNYDANVYQVEMYSFDNEVIWFCDIRAFIFGLSYSDFWYMLPLYSKYKIVHPQYMSLMLDIYQKREQYAYNNVINFASSAKKHVDGLAQFFTPAANKATRNKKLYYICLNFMATNAYKYHKPIESIFYNEKYGNILQKIKFGEYTDDVYNKLYTSMAATIKSFHPTEINYPSSDKLVEFSQKQIDKILQIYREYKKE